MSHLWTTYEKSWRLVALEGTVLVNRMFWVAVGLTAFALTWRGFRFQHRTERPGWWKTRGARRSRAVVQSAKATSTRDHGAAATAVMPRQITVPSGAAQFGILAQCRVALAVARRAFASLAGSWAGLAMLTLVPLLTIVVVGRSDGGRRGESRAGHTTRAARTHRATQRRTQPMDLRAIRHRVLCRRADLA